MRFEIRKCEGMLISGCLMNDLWVIRLVLNKISINW